MTAPQNHTQAESLRRQTQTAILGPRALLVFGGAVFLIVLIMQISHLYPLGYPGGLLYVFFALTIGGLASIVSAVLGIVSLRRNEHPRWPAVMALALSLLPALGIILILILPLWDALVRHSVK